ncbi:hypothetical protein HOI26_05795 [Candidatus Woesearchaeota archaeon]|jgi:hypothetical protein|nr:hypothetical protein [Candidatus Woesearchaeota archaeon]MBT5740580.1 hypothetical protein [Candidatus Woesearchaeota archaeon]
MPSARKWTIINISLGLVAVLLLVTFLDVELPSLGKAFYLSDSSDPICIVDWQGELNEFSDLDRCCLEARKQLYCDVVVRSINGSNIDRVCHSGKTLVDDNSLRYWLNNKAHGYCQYEQTAVWG